MINEIVSTGSVTFDPSSPKCQLNIFRGCAGTVAFVKALDTGWEGATGTCKYWGNWCDSDPKGSLLTIMARGGKWRKLPEM